MALSSKQKKNLGWLALIAAVLLFVKFELASEEASRQAVFYDGSPDRYVENCGTYGGVIYQMSNTQNYCYESPGSVPCGAQYSNVYMDCNDGTQKTPARFELITFTDYSDQKLSAEETYPIIAKVKNVGGTKGDINIEAGFYETEAAEMFNLQRTGVGSTIHDVANCVVAEEFVDTRKISGLRPGDSVTVTLAPKGPGKLSKIGADQKTSNWGDKYIELVGLYEACGQSHIDNGYGKNIEFTYVEADVTTDSSGTGKVKDSTGDIEPEQCTKTRDCSWWIIGDVECKNAICVDVVKEAKEDIDVVQYFKDNTWILWALIGVLVVIFFVWGFSDKKQPGGF